MKRRRRQCQVCVKKGMSKHATWYMLKKVGKGKYECIRCGSTVTIPDKKKKK